jgi:hypothetical protein
MQIIVLGMHRSGTSAVTRLINMMGAWFGPEGMSLGANEHNAKGFWERRDFVQLNQQILAARRCTGLDVRNWPAGDRPPLDPALAQKMRFSALELDAHRPWVLKDPRFCITLPDWRDLLEVPLAVIVARDPLEVARSLEQRDGFPTEFGIALWEYYAVHTLRNAASLPRVFVPHEAVLASPVSATRALLDGLKANDVKRLELPSDREILAFIEPRLYRARAREASVSLTEPQQRLNAMLRAEVPFDPAIEVSANSRDVMARLSASVHHKIGGASPARA